MIGPDALNKRQRYPASYVSLLCCPIGDRPRRFEPTSTSENTGKKSVPVPLAARS